MKKPVNFASMVVIGFMIDVSRAGPASPVLPETLPTVAPYTSILATHNASAVEEAVSSATHGEEIAEIAEAPTEDERVEAMEVEYRITPSNEIGTAEMVMSNETAETIQHADNEGSVLVAEVAEAAPTTAQIQPAFENISFSFASGNTQKKVIRKAHPVRTPKALLRKTKPRRKPVRRFGMLGASLEEAHLHEGEDSRKSERRMGDSDLEWGDGSEVEDAIEELSTGIGAMEIDGDLDAEAMANFVKGMGAERSQHVTMDDIADIELLKAEDEEESSTEEEDSEIEAAVRLDEDAFLAESAHVTKGTDGEDGGEDDEDISSEDEDTPRRGFQARLERIRRNAKGKKKAQPAEESSSDDDEDDDDDMYLDVPWADKDDSMIEQIQVGRNSIDQIS